MNVKKGQNLSKKFASGVSSKNLDFLLKTDIVFFICLSRRCIRLLFKLIYSLAFFKIWLCSSDIYASKKKVAFGSTFHEEEENEPEKSGKNSKKKKKKKKSTLSQEEKMAVNLFFELLITVY